MAETARLPQRLNYAVTVLLVNPTDTKADFRLGVDSAPNLPPARSFFSYIHHSRLAPAKVSLRNQIKAIN